MTLLHWKTYLFKAVAIWATLLSTQAQADDLPAQEPTKPKTHIEWKVLETKLWTERALLVEKTAYEMMNAGEIPVMKIKKYSALAWPVPQGYFDEVKENYWDETAKKYQEFASYFTDLVVEKKQNYIAKRLLWVFKNPWNSKAWDLFIKKLKKYSNWKDVSQEKLDELKELTDKMWVVLNKEIKDTRLAIAQKEEIIKNLEEKIQKAKKELDILKQEELKYKQEELKYKQEEFKYKQEEFKYKQEEFKYKQEELKYKQEELKYKQEIEKLKKLIEKRDNEIKNLKNNYS